MIVVVVDGEEYPWLFMRYGRPNDENLAAFIQRYLKARRTRCNEAYIKDTKRGRVYGRWKAEQH